MESKNILEQQIKTALSFWPDVQTGGDFEYHQHICYQFQSLPVDRQTLFYPPQTTVFVGQNDCLYYEKEGNVFVISLNAQKPYYRKMSNHGPWSKMTAKMVHQILSECLQSHADKEKLVAQFESLFAQTLNNPSGDMPSVKPLPNIRQVLALAYIRALQAGQQTLPDIDATLCDNNCVCGKKGDIFYKITLNIPATFSAFENGTIRQMTIDEVRTVIAQLRKQHTPLYLQNNQLTGLLERYKTEGGVSFERIELPDNLSIKELFRFDSTTLFNHKLKAFMAQSTEQENNDENKIFLNNGDSVVLMDFLRDADSRPNAYYHYQNADNRNLSDTEPIITKENELSFRKNGLTYFISLDLNNPLFVKKNKAYFLLLPQEIRTILSDIFQNDPSKRNELLQKLTTVYSHARTRRDDVAGFPTIEQVVSNHTLEGDIPATLCAGGVLIARYNNVFYKMHLKPVTAFMKWENCVIQHMNEADIALIYDNIKSWSYQTLVQWGLHKGTLLQKLASADKQLFVFKDTRDTRPLADRVFDLVQSSSIQAASVEQTEKLFGALEMLQALQQNSYSFIGDEAFLPHYETLYKTAFIKHKLAHGKNALEKEFSIPPVICSDGCLHYKDGVYEYAFSLDENKPYFSWRRVNGGSQYFSFGKLEEIIHKMDIPSEMQNKMVMLCKRVYQKWQISDRHEKIHTPAPRFDQTVELLTLSAQLNGEPILSDIDPIICNDGVVYARYNSIYYKMRTKEPFCFEALEGNTVRVMTSDEFERIAAKIRESSSMAHKMSFTVLRAAFAEMSWNKETRIIPRTGISTSYTLPTVKQAIEQALIELEKNTSDIVVDISQVAQDLSTRLEALLARKKESSVVGDFYDESTTLIDFNTQYSIEKLKQAIQHKNSDVSSLENDDFEMAPVFTNDGRIHYRKGPEHFILSLNPNDTFFAVCHVNGSRHFITLANALSVLTMATQADETLQRDIQMHLPAIYANYFARKQAKRSRINTLPRFDQVIEEANLKAALAGLPSPEDIEATLCSGQMICARYNGIYYKIKLQPKLVVEALENEKQRLATHAELKRILTDLLKRYDIRYGGPAFADTIRAMKKEVAAISVKVVSPPVVVSKPAQEKSVVSKPKQKQTPKALKEESSEKVILPTPTVSVTTVEVPQAADVPVSKKKRVKPVSTPIAPVTVVEKPQAADVLTPKKKRVKPVPTPIAPVTVVEVPQAADVPTPKKKRVKPAPMPIAPVTAVEVPQVADVSTPKKKRVKLVPSPVLPVKEAPSVAPIQSIRTLPPVVETVAKSETTKIESDIQVPAQKSTSSTSVQPTENAGQVSTTQSTSDEKKKSLAKRPSQRLVRWIKEDEAADTISLTATEKFKALWFANQQTTDSLVPDTYPQAILPPFPEDMFRLPSHEEFFGEITGLPEAQLLYLTHLYQARRNVGKKIFYNKQDIMLVNIDPVLCAGSILMAKKQQYLMELSLDKNNPYFSVTDLMTNQQYMMSWETVQNLMKKWLGDNQQTTSILSELKPIHQEYLENPQIRKRPVATPPIEQVFHLYAMQEAYREKAGFLSSDTDKNLFVIPPTCCNGNTIFSRIGNIYYKIQIGKEITFHRFSQHETWLMTPKEFQMVINAARDNNVFPKETAAEMSALLRQIYKEKQEPIFNALQLAQISLHHYKRICDNPSIHVQKSGGVWGRTRGAREA